MKIKLLTILRYQAANIILEVGRAVSIKRESRKEAKMKKMKEKKTKSLILLSQYWKD